MDVHDDCGNEGSHGVGAQQHRQIGTGCEASAGGCSGVDVAGAGTDGHSCKLPGARCECKFHCKQRLTVGMHWSDSAALSGGASSAMCGGRGGPVIQRRWCRDAHWLSAGLLLEMDPEMTLAVGLWWQGSTESERRNAGSEGVSGQWR
jgi:hypothetical protein